MPITDYKVTDVERNAVYVQSQADTLAGTAAQNKAVFDAYPELVRDNLDGLCDFLANMPTSHTVSTAAATTTKTPISYYVPIGAVIELIFTNGNTAAAPTIAIDGVTHSISGLPAVAKLANSGNQTYRVQRTDGTTLTFLDDPNYICEYGTDAGGWVYELYANGVSKTWKKGGSVTYGNSVAFGTLYTRSTTGTNGAGLALPAVFNAVPLCTATLAASATTITSPYGYASGTGPYVAHVQILTTVNSSSGAAGTADFFAVGTWK